MKRGLVAVAAFAALPIARLFANNPGESLPLSRYVVYWVITVFVVALIVLLIYRRDHEATDRAATASALIVFSIAYLAVALRSSLQVPAILAIDGSVWVAAGLVAVAVFLSRSHFVRKLLPVVAVALLAYPITEIVVHTVQRSDSTASVDTAGLDLDPRSTPNIYWIVADGYVGPEVITDDYGYENENEFLDSLVDEGFEVSRAAVAAYPMTHLSMASTLAMEYVVEADDKISDPLPFYQAVQGDNALVDTLKSWGYEFAIYSGGFYGATQCGGREDVCLRGASLDPADRALLAMTPIASLIEGPRTAETHAELSNPLSVLASLDEHPTNKPRFVLAHLLDPHPPFYRGGDDCHVRDVAFNVGSPWEPDEDYVEAVGCLNRLLQSMVEKLIESDPEAVIVLQGDHGPNLGIAFEHGHDVSTWTPRQVRVRFSVLSAMRLPDGCAVPSEMSLVNTFKVVLGCLSGEPVPLLPTRTFTANSYPGDVEEIDPPT